MSKKFAFTICSINYLAQAKTLGQTLAKTNPDYEFVIGLCDKVEGSGVDKTKLEGLTLLEVDKIGIERFASMCDRYDITELNTAVKPFYFDYFFNKRSDIESVLYFDPDIEMFDNLSGIEQGLENHNIVLTPHLYTPIFDDLLPREQQIFVNGIYNLGFVAVKKSTESQKFIDWWKTKLETECYMDVQKGMFVDQLYCNMVPLYFEGVKIDKYPGYNISYWNLHERQLTSTQGGYFFNEKPLVFYHYSGMDIVAKDTISRWTQRHDLHNRPELRPIYDGYRKQLADNENAYFKTIPCYYLKPKVEPKKKSIIKRILTSITFRIYHFFDTLPI
ncbi:MAG: glycosyl transferase [Leadbetterella sp.]